MMGDIGKTLSTIAVWAALGLIAMMAVIDNSSMTGMWVALGAMLTALAATVVIWVVAEAVKKPGPPKTTRETSDHLRAAEKAKRQPGDRLSLLLELMDDDEREAFKETLKQRIMDDMRLNDDGELDYHTTLEDLLDDDSIRQQRRR
jgi:hypothetical protein